MFSFFFNCNIFLIFTTALNLKNFINAGPHCWTYTAQKMKFSIKDFSSKCDQIRMKLRNRSHLLQKSLMKSFTFCAVFHPKQERLGNGINCVQ